MQGKKQQWNGNWSDNSPFWTKDLKQKCYHYPGLEDGLFFVDLKEFRFKFPFFEICYTHEEFQSSVLKARQSYIHHACFFEFTVAQFGLFYISVEQKNIRHYGKYSGYKYSPIQIILAKKIDNNNYELIDLKKNNDMEFWIKTELGKGDYIIYVRPYWEDMDVTKEFLVSTFAANKVQIKQIPRIKNFLYNLFLAKIKSNFEQATLSEVVFELVLDKSKGIGYYWVRNNSTKNAISIKTEFRLNKAYKFKKPYKDENIIMTISQECEDIAIFTLQNLDYEELKIVSQQIAKLD